MQCLVRVGPERQCSGDPGLLIQLPNRASQEQPAHHPLYESGGRALQVDPDTAFTTMSNHILGILCPPISSVYTTGF